MHHRSCMQLVTVQDKVHHAGLHAEAVLAAQSTCSPKTISKPIHIIETSNSLAPQFLKSRNFKKRYLGRFRRFPPSRRRFPPSRRQFPLWLFSTNFKNCHLRFQIIRKSALSKTTWPSVSSKCSYVLLAPDARASGEVKLQARYTTQLNAAQHGGKSAEPLGYQRLVGSRDLK